MTSPIVRLTICHSCRGGGSGLHEALRDAMAEKAAWLRISTVDCMSGCARPTTVAIRSSGKTAYLFGDLDAKHVPLLEAFVGYYRESTDGNFADARILGDLRFKAIARIPGH